MLKKQNASVLAHVADINVARRGADRILRETPGQTKEPTRNAGGRGAECAGAALVPAVPTTAVALYLRVSTGPQAKRDLSIPDQREALQKFCAARGWNPVAEYVDVGTGTNDLRAGFQEMISALTEGRVKVAMIVVHSFSRFYRDEVEAELYFRSLRRAGVEVVSMTQEVSTDSSGDFVRRIFALFDEHTSRETSKHVRRTLRENARQQFFCGGRPPFGYTSVDAERKRDTIKKRLEIETNEADLVRRIYDLFLRGDGRSGPMGVKAITTYLNGHDVRYRNRRRWGAGDVHRVLTDTVYIGEYVFNRNADECRQVVVPVPAIVDAARFSQVRALLRERNPKRSPPRTTSGPTLLAGLIKCGCCGASMIIQTGKGGRYRYYGCGRVAREGKSGCNGMRARMDEIDSSLRSAVASELFHPDRVEKILGAVIARRNAAADGLDEQAERLRHRLREAEARLKRLWDAIECGLTTPSDRQCQDRIRAANACREIAQNELQKALDLQRGSAVMGTQIAGDFAEILRDKFLQRESGFARLYLRSVIERVIVGNETIQIDWRHEAEPNIAFRLRNGTACVAPPLILRRVNKP